MTKQPAGPRWLDRALKYLGTAEIAGPRHNPKIVGMLELLKAPFRDDETPWCGTFVGGALAYEGMEVVANPWGARNWLKYGKEIDSPAYGSIVVFWRGKRSGWSGHVGFVVGEDRLGNLMVLGGNQGNAVTIKPFSKARVLGYRWPGIAPFDTRYALPVLNSDGKLSSNEA